MTSEILNIAKQQYTPIPFLEPDSKEQQKVKALNNYQLIAFMESVRPGASSLDSNCAHLQVITWLMGCL